MLDILDLIVLAALGKHLWRHAAIVSFGGSKESSTQRQTQKQNFNQSTQRNPWETQSPYLQQGFQQAGAWLQNAQNPNANMQQGWANQLSQAGQMGNVAQSAAQGNQFLSSTAQLDPSTNPYLQANLDILQGELGKSLNQVNQGAAGAGMFGGSRQGVAQGEAVTGAQNAAANMLSQNYQQGAQNMINAQALSGQVGQGLLMPGQAQTSVGMQQQYAPMDALNQYWNIVGGNQWGGTEATQGTSKSTSTSRGSSKSGGFGLSLG